jgi:hypothetical protein
MNTLTIKYKIFLITFISLIPISSYSYWESGYWIPERDEFYSEDYLVAPPVTIIPYAPPEYDEYPEYYPSYYDNPYNYSYSSALVGGYLGGVATFALWNNWGGYGGWYGSGWGWNNNNNWNNNWGHWNQNNTDNITNNNPVNNKIINNTNVNARANAIAAENRNNLQRQTNINQARSQYQQNHQQYDHRYQQRAIPRSYMQDQYRYPVQSAYSRNVRIQGYDPGQFHQRQDFPSQNFHGGFGGFHGGGGGFHGGGRR